MSVKIHSNTQEILAKNHSQASVALRFILDDIDKTSQPNTPRDTGQLRQDILKQVLGLHGQIRWGKRYAIYQENKHYSSYTTPGTGPHFAENAVNEVLRRSTTHFRRAGMNI